VSDKQSTILVIEDESQLRKFLRVILETHDYAVIDASTGEEGLRKAATEQPEQVKVVALDAGADDYLTKPFNVGELLARVRVAMRHLAAANKNTGDPIFTVGELHIDLGRRSVIANGSEVHLTPNEFRLLAILAKHAGRVMTHRQLLEEVWGPESHQETHYLRVYMNQLRQKLEPDPTQPSYLLTEPGVGYRLAMDAE